jgi:hypothetical protein
MAREQQGCDRKPLARLFFDPQNTMVISSAREKPSRRLAKVRDCPVLGAPARGKRKMVTGKAGQGGVCDTPPQADRGPHDLAGFAAAVGLIC